eukprot:1184224-Prorocentrum_minimum.AAC.1
MSEVYNPFNPTSSHLKCYYCGVAVTNLARTPPQWAQPQWRVRADSQRQWPRCAYCHLLADPPPACPPQVRHSRHGGGSDGAAGVTLSSRVAHIAYWRYAVAFICLECTTFGISSIAHHTVSVVYGPHDTVCTYNGCMKKRRSYGKSRWATCAGTFVGRLAFPVPWPVPSCPL